MSTLENPSTSQPARFILKVILECMLSLIRRGSVRSIIDLTIQLVEPPASDCRLTIVFLFHPARGKTTTSRFREALCYSIIQDVVVQLKTLVGTLYTDLVENPVGTESPLPTEPTARLLGGYEILVPTHIKGCPQLHLIFSGDGVTPLFPNDFESTTLLTWKVGDHPVRHWVGRALDELPLAEEKTRATTRKTLQQIRDQFVTNVSKLDQVN